MNAFLPGHYATKLAIRAFILLVALCIALGLNDAIHWRLPEDTFLKRFMTVFGFYATMAFMQCAMFGALISMAIKIQHLARPKALFAWALPLALCLTDVIFYFRPVSSIFLPVVCFPAIVASGISLQGLFHETDTKA